MFFEDSLRKVHGICNCHRNKMMTKAIRHDQDDHENP